MQSKGEEEMKIRRFILSAAALLFAAPAVIAGGTLTVTKEAIINTDAKTLWATVGGFGTLHTWHPGVASTVLTGNGSTVGDKRELTLGDGAKVYETLEGLDNEKMQQSYTITQSPLPVANYHSTISVSAAGEGKANFKWTSTFEAAGAPDADAMNAVGGIYQGGIDALNAKFK
jgi:mxaD protein